MPTATIEPGRVSRLARWLGIFLAPGQVCECRGLHVQGKRAVISFHDSPESLAVRALELDALGAVGVYFTPNPLRRDILAAGKSCRAEDVLARHWLLIDCDPVRPAGLSSTEGERQAAYQVAQRVMGCMEAAGAAGPVVADSGNGFHVCYAIDLPADEPAKDLIRSILKGLDVRCSDEFAKVDTSTHDAPRIWKVYGTRARKGEPTEDRPHRYTQLLEGAPPTAARRQANTDALRRLLQIWRRQDELFTGRPSEPLSGESRYAQAALLKECQAIATAGVGNRNNQLNESAFAVGTLIGTGLLTREECETALLAAAVRVGLPEGEARRTIHSGLEAGIANPRDLTGIRGTTGGHNGTHHANGTARVQAEPEPPTEDDPDATLADLISINATVRWVWPGWVQLSVLTGLAAEPGTGKTRLCMDIARRLAKRLAWPDGVENTYPAGSRTLWLPADNHHAELATICEQYGLDPALVYLNASRSNPFGGTSLDTDDDRKALEKRIVRVKPALVIVDTILGTTDKNAYATEDAKALYKPLQEIALRQQCAIVCVTHTNKAGQAIGRRILGQCRVVMQMDHPDKSQENRRRFWVEKSNSLKPPALGVTMGTPGNEYDLQPPVPVEEGSARRGRPDEKLQAAIDWLRERLKNGPKRVSHLRADGELEGLSAKTLYRAIRESGEFEEFEAEGKKWWQVASINEEQ